MHVLKKMREVESWKSVNEKSISPSKESAVRSLWVQIRIYVYTRAWPRACCRPCIPRAGHPVPTWVFWNENHIYFSFYSNLRSAGDWLQGAEVIVTKRFEDHRSDFVIGLCKNQGGCAWCWHSLSSFVCHRSEILFSEPKNIWISVPWSK